MYLCKLVYICNIIYSRIITSHFQIFPSRIRVDLHAACRAGPVPALHFSDDFALASFLTAFAILLV